MPFHCLGFISFNSLLAGFKRRDDLPPSIALALAGEIRHIRQDGLEARTGRRYRKEEGKEATNRLLNFIGW